MTDPESAEAPLGGVPAPPPRWSALDRGVGRPVVFLHGYPLNHTMWGPQVDPLSDGHRVVLIDLPGFGFARDHRAPEQFWPYVEEIGWALEAHLTTPAVVVGHSFGGYLALGLYRTHPRLFAGLALADTRSDPDTAKARETRLATAARLEGPNERLAVDDVARGLVAPATWATGGAVVEHVRAMVNEAASPAVVSALRAIADRPDLGPILPTISVPTIVLWGAEDQLIPPEQSESMTRRIVGSTGVAIPGAGHVPSLEAPDSFNGALRHFLDSLPPPR